MEIPTLTQEERIDDAVRRPDRASDDSARRCDECGRPLHGYEAITITSRHVHPYCVSVARYVTMSVAELEVHSGPLDSSSDTHGEFQRDLDRERWLQQEDDAQFSRDARR